MKKRIDRKTLLSSQQDEQGTADAIKKVQQQLSVIGRKLDILIKQSVKRPFDRNQSQNPPRRFEQSHSHDRGRHDNYQRERTYTKVTCSDCSKECEIPFKPSPGRPVYCKECFSKRRQGNQSNVRQDSRPEERDIPKERITERSQVKTNKRPSTKRQVKTKQKPMKKSASKTQAKMKKKPAKKKKTASKSRKKRA
ncbi:CxxC-x17-CxxC domain-containing protein [Candidatus Omnitrophota bacterium]